MGKKADSSGDAKGGFEIRELRATDLDRGFIDALGTLSDMGGLSSNEAGKILRRIGGNPLHRIFVAVGADGRVVGTTTLVVEQKFSHRGGMVGHIEDVAVMKSYQRRGVGGSLVKAAVGVAEELGCYKCILDCRSELVAFYEGLGFRRHEVGMRMDLKPHHRESVS